MRCNNSFDHILWTHHLTFIYGTILIFRTTYAAYLLFLLYEHYRYLVLSTIKEFERQGIVFLVIFYLFLIYVIKFLIKAALEEKSKLIEEFGLLPYLLTYEPNFNLEFLRVILFMILLIDLCQMLLWKDF